MVYLDNAATTKPCEEALSAVMTAAEMYGNPSSLHKMGIDAEKLVIDARKAVAAALVCPPECITFTSGATEANNTVLFGIAKTYGRRLNKIVVSAAEHSSIIESAKQLERNGFEVVFVPPGRDGVIDEQAFVDAVDSNTFLASCMLVNNETGAIMPVKKIFTHIKRLFPDCMTHCDAVQGFLKLPIKAADFAADLITVSAHKVHGLKGVGALYVRKGIRLTPLLYGGGQEKGVRPGTESVPLIYAFGAAVRKLHPEMKTAYSNAEELNRRLRTKLSELSFVTINSNADNFSPYILNFSVPGIRSETLLHFLESRDIYVSSGSACSKGAKSPVLSAMGLSDKLIDSAIRISFSSMSSNGDVERLATAIQEGYMTLAKVR